MAILQHAVIELEAARNSLANLQASTDLEALDAHWRTFLRHLERSWFKAQAALKKHSKWQGWNERGRVEGLRGGKDALLSYLRNARGAEEHGIDPIAVQTRGGTVIDAVAPGGAIHIDELKYDGRSISIKSGQPLRIRIDAARYTLLDVVNHGKRYAVPTSHLGSPLSGSDPVTLARAGLAFYEEFLSQAEQEFGGAGKSPAR